VDTIDVICACGKTFKAPADAFGKTGRCYACGASVPIPSNWIELAQNVLLTTTPSIDGHRIKKYLGIESVEFVIGTGLFSEITSSVQDFFGQRSSGFEKKLRDAKTYAMDALKFAAASKGANAVVGIDMDFTEFSGNRIGLILNGTLVLAERNE
jgi:uncharacterized protein YbjQ (UPF0145 family)